MGFVMANLPKVEDIKWQFIYLLALPQVKETKLQRVTGVPGYVLKT